MWVSGWTRVTEFDEVQGTEDNDSRGNKQTDRQVCVLTV